MICVSVCWSRSWVLQKRANRSRYRLEGRLGWAQGTMYYKEDRGSHGRDNFGVVWSIEKHWELVLRRFKQNKSITATTGLRPAAMSQTGRCHITLFRVKKPLLLRCGLSSKFFDHLLLLLPTPRQSQGQVFICLISERNLTNRCS